MQRINTCLLCAGVKLLALSFLMLLNNPQTFCIRSRMSLSSTVNLLWNTTLQYSVRLRMYSMYTSIRSSIFTPTYFNLVRSETLEYDLMQISLVFFVHFISSVSHRPNIFVSVTQPILTPPPPLSLHFTLSPCNSNIMTS